MAQHAKLSPSAAHRWMNCEGSVALIGDESSTAGIEARRGTAAHKVVETCLKEGVKDASVYHGRAILVHIPSVEETIIVPEGETFGVSEEWEAFTCDDTMVAGVQMMLDEVERVTTDECFDPELFTERYIDMSWLDPRFGGTADVTLVDVSWIHLFDYKNGRIVVEVEDNEQFLNYAVGLLHEHPDAGGVTIHLVQPNGIHEDGHIRDVSYNADEIKLFEIKMKAAADATARPNAPRRAGDWCGFCPAKIRCPDFENKALEEAGMDFASDPYDVASPVSGIDDVTDPDGSVYREGLARKRKWIPLLDQWAREINQAIFNELMNGRDVPGCKLVQGKTNRVWAEGAKESLVELGVPEESLYTEPKLKTPAQVEKIRPVPEGYKPGTFKKKVGEFAFKPPGRVTVAGVEDAREAIDPATAAAADFAGDDPNDESDFAA
jgi:hypothetical protein